MDQQPKTRPERRRLTHVDRAGRPRMVDVSEKPPTARRAVAEAFVTMGQETLSLIIDGGGPKGDVLTVAELAGVMGGKRTSDLIPLCHPVALTDLVVRITPDRVAGGLRIRAEAATTGPTGVEMEALTAASIAALTAYDMVKGVERGVEIRSIALLSKSGGRSGEWHRDGGPDQPRPHAQRSPAGARSAGRITRKRVHVPPPARGSSVDVSSAKGFRISGGGAKSLSSVTLLGLGTQISRLTTSSSRESARGGCSVPIVKCPCAETSSALASSWAPDPPSVVRVDAGPGNRADRSCAREATHPTTVGSLTLERVIPII